MKMSGISPYSDSWTWGAFFQSIWIRIVVVFVDGGVLLSFCAIGGMIIAVC